MERLCRVLLEKNLYLHITVAECKAVYGGMYPHFWKKWCVATDKGTFGAAERFYLELSEDNRRILVERAVSIYDGRGLRNRNRNIKNQTACRETLSV